MKLSVHLLLDRADLPGLRHIEGRAFAVGWMPPRELLAPDFGIRVAANSLYMPAMGLDPEWSRALAHDGLIRGMTGSHTVHVEMRPPMEAVLAELLARYTATRYRAHVPLLDVMRAVPKHLNVVAQLDLTLEHRVRTGLHVGLGWAVEPSDDIRAFRLHGDGLPTSPTTTPSLVWVREHLMRSGSGRVPRLQVEALDHDGNVLHSKPLRDYVTAELRHRGEFYVLADGRWFLVSRAELAHLEGELAGIPDVTGEIAMQPCVSLAHHADLLTRDADLVFTKKSYGRGSATAKRYREWPDCHAELAAIHQIEWPDVPFREPRLVYALDSPGPGTLPFLSKVNLWHHVTRIHAQDLEVAFARNPLPACSVPRPRTEGLPLRDHH